MQPQSDLEGELPIVAPRLSKLRYDKVAKVVIVKRAAGVRRITVGSLYRPAKKGSLPTSVPYIRLSGKWLERAGFLPNDKVEVKVSQGELNIRAAQGAFPLVSGE
ncbi:MAG: type I toxin-antitoxin system SymE family toxin [Verrucomicrobiaceae bacterium]|nr:MAG: type I toxin-antitoxin system SymE family toxin [Verrucomicrobiaceae bacterium]